MDHVDADHCVGLLNWPGRRKRRVDRRENIADAQCIAHLPHQMVARNEGRLVARTSRGAVFFCSLFGKAAAPYRGPIVEGAGTANRLRRARVPSGLDAASHNRRKFNVKSAPLRTMRSRRSCVSDRSSGRACNKPSLCLKPAPKPPPGLARECRTTSPSRPRPSRTSRMADKTAREMCRPLSPHHRTLRQIGHSGRN